MSCANLVRRPHTPLLSRTTIPGRTTIHFYDLYVSILGRCIESKSLKEAKTVHQHLLKNGNNNPIVLGKLTRLYISFNELEVARRVFDEIPNPERKNNVILWNQLIRAYAWKGPFGRAIDLYYEMVESGVIPNKYTYPFVLKACSGLQAVEDGKMVHDQARRNGLVSDVYISTSLVDFYAKCGCLVEARKVFDIMPERDVVAWNAMVAGSSLHGLYGDAMRLVVQMQEEGLCPNPSTVVAVLPAIGEVNGLSAGKAVHGYCLRRSFHSDLMVATGLLDMYGKCGCLVYASRIFDLMGMKNEVTWGAMIGAYVSCDFAIRSLELYDQMLRDGLCLSPVILGTILRACSNMTDLSRGRQIHGSIVKSGYLVDLMVGNTLLSMYAKCGIIEDAVRLFGEMESKDLVSHNAIISGCAQNGKAKEALVTFQEMKLSGLEPDSTTLVSFLPACSHLAALQHGACGHCYSIVSGFSTDTSICNALIDMYSKCGKVDTARLVFDRMRTRDIVSWNAMIFGYGIHGLGKKAVLLFHDMEIAGLRPDDVTFICLLSACSHSGLVDEGKKCFFAMSQYFYITPRMEHYVCMVDLLGRAGLLYEALGFIEKMPCDPDFCVWSALLAACRTHGNIELGEEVSNKIQKMGHESSGNFVILSNMYSVAGRWDDAAHVRIKQRDQGFKKRPGCSWVEINGVIHAFVGGDQSHPRSAEIYNKLADLLMEMKRLGYQSESSFVFQDVEEEEKESILLYHSEKLAVTFGILTLGSDKPILVTKNLRICGDCHEALKYITIITRRKITVRDASRFHHFKDGICNCGDFW
ncbi:pentatricopeptide repeat-containing protein At3g16610 [Rhododendron vialii]|uniref:pentatricopeptide repeat-containing protein At3g16610 n=1 Tax=Rhododendron vialii TaxID=182163 RepID=UPI00265FA765|nr:pentatricopeptide repeat-containing protein At3g16610 [Rhododendron vialii]XP_058208710.1 pentatricopeptide repeat-containing protein At3g16610 [Rhododendron vialii]XP_058208711.1 pentatricopeptide repeat-containing protein At3g16610 [Rhododendron vialii]